MSSTPNDLRLWEAQVKSALVEFFKGVGVALDASDDLKIDHILGKFSSHYPAFDARQKVTTDVLTEIKLGVASAGSLTNKEERNKATIILENSLYHKGIVLIVDAMLPLGSDIASLDKKRLEQELDILVAKPIENPNPEGNQGVFWSAEFIAEAINKRLKGNVMRIVEASERYFAEEEDHSGARVRPIAAQIVKMLEELKYEKVEDKKVLRKEFPKKLLQNKHLLMVALIHLAMSHLDEWGPELSDFRKFMPELREQDIKDVAAIEKILLKMQYGITLDDQFAADTYVIRKGSVKERIDALRTKSEKKVLAPAPAPSRKDGEHTPALAKPPLPAKTKHSEGHRAEHLKKKHAPIVVDEAKSKGRGNNTIV